MYLFHLKDYILNGNSKTDDLTWIILEVINEKKPQSIKQFVNMLKKDLELTEGDVIKLILKLEAKGALKFKNTPLKSQSLIIYLKTGEAVWYWLTIIIGVITSILVFTISENFFPWVYARNVLGVIFVFCLPGFAFIKVFFQHNTSINTFEGNLKTIMSMSLSIGLSITLTSIIGLFLYYSPWGLNLNTIVFSLLTFTSFVATVGVIRDYQKKKTNLKKDSAR